MAGLDGDRVYVPAVLASVDFWAKGPSYSATVLLIVRALLNSTSVCYLMQSSAPAIKSLTLERRNS